VEAEIDFLYETDFSLANEAAHKLWLIRCARKHQCRSLQLAFAFMDDTALHKLNVKHLSHDTLTDIITFDDTVGKDISANIAISIERVMANATEYNQPFETELLRVMAHGLLHCLGYKDKSSSDKSSMRDEEERCINLFHVEQNSLDHV
jgi:rRNA maturation RNase YbeY